MIIEYPDKRYTVEPANVHCISYIKSINIANVERTLAGSTVYLLSGYSIIIIAMD